MIALSTGSLYSYGLARTFELAKETGFDGVELMVDHRWDARQADYLKPASRITWDCRSPACTRRSSLIFPAGRTMVWQACKQAVALAEAVGARTVVAHLPDRLSYIIVNWRALRAKPFYLKYPRTVDKPYLRWLGDGLAGFQGTTEGDDCARKPALPLPVAWSVQEAAGT